MKKITMLLTGAFFSVSTMGAFATSTDNTVIESKFFDGQKTKVEKNELPQEVIQSLEESEYQNWEIQEAYKIDDELTNEVRYELHLASEVDTEMVRNVTFNESGEIIRDEKSDLGRTDDQIFDQEEGTEPGLDRTEPSIDGTEPGLDGTEQDTEGQQY